MTDESLDKLFREKAFELENTPLPQWPTTDALWSKLITKRQQSKQRKSLWCGVAAAMLVIAIGAYAFIKHNNPSESPYGISNNTSLSPSKEDALNFIARYCAAKNVSCNTPDILQLRQDLEQSFDKMKEIDQQLQVYGSDPELIRAKDRIQSHQARLIKTIVQTL